jgi:hypothetical protein
MTTAAERPSHRRIRPLKGVMARLYGHADRLAENSRNVTNPSDHFVRCQLADTEKLLVRKSIPPLDEVIS